MNKWLKQLKLQEYEKCLHKEGYRTGDDIVNLKDLDKPQLEALGITKRGNNNAAFFYNAYLILPVFGIILQIIPTFSAKKQIFG